MTYFTARSNFVTKAFLLEKVKIIHFSESIKASDLKVSGSRYLIEYMKVCENRRSIIMKSLDPLRAKKTFIRKKLGQTAVLAIKASSVTL